MRFKQYMTEQGYEMTVPRFFRLLGDNAPKYTIVPDGVNVFGSLDIKWDMSSQITSLTKLPFKFNVVHGDFNCMHLPLTSIEGLPKLTNGDLLIGSMTSSKITSLVGINDIIEWIGPSGKRTQMRARFSAPFQKIKEGGLGLILIRGKFTLDGLGYELPEPFKIIEKYLGRRDDLFECQTELIENGFEEFAKL